MERYASPRVWRRPACRRRIIVSSPVYFGDRGSLVQSLFEFIESDPLLRQDMAGKIYGGLAVGAKRNGGQETTLIYQMLDMLDMGLLAVGNGHETTAQYGGTAKAGDVGRSQPTRTGSRLASEPAAGSPAPPR